MRKRLAAMVVGTLLLQLALLPACAHGPSERGASQSAVPNADGRVAVSTAGNPRELTMPATEESVRLIGRTCASDGVTWLPQSGSAIEFAVTGTRVTIELAGDDHVRQD